MDNYTIDKLEELERIVWEVGEMLKPYPTCICGNFWEAGFDELRLMHICGNCKGLMLPQREEPWDDQQK